LRGGNGAGGKAGCCEQQEEPQGWLLACRWWVGCKRCSAPVVEKRGKALRGDPGYPAMPGYGQAGSGGGTGGAAAAARWSCLPASPLMPASEPSPAAARSSSRSSSRRPLSPAHSHRLRCWVVGGGQRRRGRVCGGARGGGRVLLCCCVVVPRTTLPPPPPPLLLTWPPGHRAHPAALPRPARARTGGTPVELAAPPAARRPPSPLDAAGGGVAKVLQLVCANHDATGGRRRRAGPLKLCRGQTSKGMGGRGGERQQGMRGGEKGGSRCLPSAAVVHTRTEGKGSDNRMVHAYTPAQLRARHAVRAEARRITSSARAAHGVPPPPLPHPLLPPTGLAAPAPPAPSPPTS
jgi:hypothetical protein